MFHEHGMERRRLRTQSAARTSLAAQERGPPSLVIWTDEYDPMDQILSQFSMQARKLLIGGEARSLNQK